MKTLYIGAYGFGNLGDELVLIESIQAFSYSPAHSQVLNGKSEIDEVWVRSVAKDYTAKFIKADGYIQWEPACPDKNFPLKFDRVIMGGGGILNGLPGRDYMSWIVAAQHSGAKTYIHNVGASGPNDASWINDDIREAFEKLDGFTVRDEDSLSKFKNWGIKRDIGLTKFPEINLPIDRTIANTLPEGKYLGISVNNGHAFFEMVHKNADKIAEFLVDYKNRGYKIIPIISTVHRFAEVEDDIKGFQRFAETFLKDFEIVLPETLNHEWWYENMSPQRLKGLINKCDTLFSRRKHNCVHSIACGVKTVGLSRKDDYGVQSVFDSLKDILPEGSFSLRF